MWLLVSNGLKLPRMISQLIVQTQMYLLVVDYVRICSDFDACTQSRREPRLNLFSYLYLFRYCSKPCFYPVSEESVMIFWVIIGSFDLFLTPLFHVSFAACGKRLFFILVVCVFLVVFCPVECL